MIDGRESRPLIVALSALAAFAVLSSGCAGVRPAQPPGGGGGSGASGGNNTGSNDAGADRPQGRPDGGVVPDAAACTTRVACVQSTGRYCGVIGDGCNSTQDCGACPGDGICEKGVCVAGASCTPGVCPANGAVQYCGSIGDGCGRALDCGTCPTGKNCVSGICVDPSCVPLTCDTATGVHYCGAIGDGCGGTLNCTCATGTCGGGGIPNVCGSTSCPTAITCMPAGGGQYCGTIGNGCGGLLTCPTTCPGGMPCQANGICAGSTSTACQRLQCQIQACTPTTKTSISGTVFDPAGRTPLYNAVVYIPNNPLDPITEGVTCDRCSVTLSGAVATALSDTAGHFTLTNAPSGTNIPLVIQVGKWRRQVTIPNVNPCVDNPVPADLSRLPRNQTEGHLPKIALTTGGADALECFLRKVGISDSEFTVDSGTGRVNLYTGGEAMTLGGGQGAASFAAGGTFPFAATGLWNNPTKLLTYDILMMSCEGSQYPDFKMPYINNIKRYADAGGRMFNGHLHFYWLRSGPAPWPTTAAYIGAGTKPASPIMGTVNTSFPKGAALADWLQRVGGTTTPGQIQLYGAQYSVAAVTPPTQSWITLNPNPVAAAAVEYLSFNTPVEAMPDAQCGRVVETDIHVKEVISSQNGKDTSDSTKPFPSACLSTVLSPQEKALEFLFFDLSACIQPDTQTPEPPPPPGIPTTPPPNVNRPPAVPPPPPPPPPPNIP